MKTALPWMFLLPLVFFLGAGTVMVEQKLHQQDSGITVKDERVLGYGYQSFVVSQEDFGRYYVPLYTYANGQCKTSRTPCTIDVQISDDPHFPFVISFYGPWIEFNT